MTTPEKRNIPDDVIIRCSLCTGAGMCRLPRASLNSTNPSLQPSDLRSEEIWTEGVFLPDSGGVVHLESAHTETHNLQILGSGSFNTSILTHPTYIHKNTHRHNPYIHTNPIHIHTHTHHTHTTHRHTQRSHTYTHKHTHTISIYTHPMYPGGRT